VTSRAFRRALPAALAGALLLGTGATGAAASAHAPADLPPAWGPQFSLITQPDAGHAQLYAMIASARSSIDLTMYELQDTTATADLAAAAARGVKVRVILDGWETTSNQAAYTYLNANGVDAVWSSQVFYFTHQKTMTVDGRYSVIMTENWQSQYYSTSRDYDLVDRGQQDVQAIEDVFNADFTDTAITPGDGADLVWSPTDAQPQILNLINGAEFSIAIEAEEMDDTNVTNALIAAAQRGVYVQIIMTNDDNEYAVPFNALVQAGAHVSTYAYTASLYIHAKTILVDFGTPSARLFLGSENFSNTSLTENRELGVIISDWPTMWTVFQTDESDFIGGTPWTVSSTS
jgi:cardiolipin synthase A/B